MRSQMIPCEEQEGSTPAAPGARWAAGWLDVLLIAALFGAALPVRWLAMRGDLWLDEADYAFAAVRGFQANRGDSSDVPGQPDKLIRLRHWHPPLVAHVIGLALRWGPEERTLRFPFVLAGSLVVALVYLCGLVLYPPASPLSKGGQEGGRAVALTCAVIVLFTPLHIRASSHATPWSLVILWLLLLLWTLLRYAETRRPGWLVGAWAALGGMFVTSEVFFLSLLATAFAVPFLFWPDVKDAASRRRILLTLAAGLAIFLIIAILLWPAGLLGGAVKMLCHYVAMADDPSFPVTLCGRTYARAPKWAYLYWYWRDYRPFLLCYGFGTLTALALLLRRQVTAGRGVLLVFTAIFLVSAHGAHIIGPEYLTHVLPLLTLVGGLFFRAVSRWDRRLGLVVMMAACFVVVRRYNPDVTPGLTARAQQPRWAAAAHFLAARWQPNDRMLASQYGVVGRWYLLHVAGAPAKEWQVQALPVGKASDKLLCEIVSGVYRYVAVGSPFSNQPNLDSRLRQILRTWPLVWQSDEGGAGPSRLVIYQLPRGVTHRTPLPLPPE